MNVSQVNCTPIKPQASFGSNKGLSYDEVKVKTGAVNDAFVNSNEIKGPFAAVASIAMAGLVAYAGGKKAGNLVSMLTKGKLPQVVMGGLEKAAKAINGKSGEIIANVETATKTGKIKNIAGKVIGKVGKLADKGMKKLAPEGIETVEKASKGFEKLVGTVAVATVFPGVVSRDKDGDGVKDILQKGQNAYTGTTAKMDSTLEKVGFVAELVDALT